MEHLFQGLLQHYFNEPVHSMGNVPFGMTNDSRIVVLNQSKYVARIYNRHTKNEERLQFEVELTAYLEHCSLSFGVPGFLSSKDGSKYVILSDGSLGSITRFIEGEVPDLSRNSDVLSYGQTVGEISYALQQFSSVPVDSVRPTIAFHDPYSLHPLSYQKSIHEFLSNPPFAIDADQIAIIQAYYQNIYGHAPEINLLPKQIVHHDILIFNLLIEPQFRKISGVLDFDFAANDIRIWELTICLNHLLQFEDQTFEKIELFLDEYRKYMTLTPAEIQWIPYVMQIYYVSLLSIYIGQHYAGRSIAPYFRLMLKQLLKRREWLEYNQHAFSDLLHSKF
ncbi:phosphotransferase enzyme family protein [Paenibacillus glucanolyticus]|uniref:phosphotransferase enzyme family protein n=1 Tax=Paenibacillus glucanolyticus TaxID=59843 RepID=UPI00096D72CA|nr:phosphotransferase [Paenibacillus glucanolyticus]MPY17057.1 phosphotransferase [Paenibacillus glucanolyticus]OMF80797.1 phosphotransferase [Paenibacillus glucanolyticus]